MKIQEKIYSFCKKRKREIGILLILISGGYLVMSISNFIEVKDKNEGDMVSTIESEMPTTQQLDEQQVINAITQDESSSGQAPTEEWNNTEILSTEIDADYIINPDFKIIGLSTDMEALIGEELDSLSEKIQENLYFNGLYGYSEAVSTGYMEVNDKENIVTICFEVKANKKILLDAIFYRNDKSWQIKVW